jgi:dUTPase
MRIKVKKTGVTLPKNATNLDTGYDLVATSDPVIVGELGELETTNESKQKEVNDLTLYSSIHYIQYHTDLFIEPIAKQRYTPQWSSPDIFKDYFHTLIFPRSSVSKYNLVLANSIGLVDRGYRGEVLVRFKYISQAEDLVANSPGFSSLVPIYTKINMDKIYKKGDKIAQLVPSQTHPVTFEVVDELSDTDRKDGGFGSTGS